MKTLGEPVSDLMMAQIMMNALPPTYAIVNTVIQTTNQASAVTPLMVKEVALKEEEHFQNIECKIVELELKKPQKKNKGPACLNCGKPSHLKQECWAAGGGAKGTGPRQKNELSEAVIKEVLHIPKLQANLMLVQELVNNRTEVAFGKDYGAVLVQIRDKVPRLVMLVKLIDSTN
ncbi:Copia-like polyprotein/retrotransposon [Rhizoctonia solani]|uniref:Copia-like polyprotein/retrotransposon n=1 Tax=Rhizoctonia solani TaxID=456999 RepID=A0A8H8P3W2_9AGAM|nr:Copia-like polyprotein/retrotransposon [Rhizoctonia solani]QRW24745.1 Copia-like polyprotein/retrotransposon [Rhizoctonia solani]